AFLQQKARSLESEIEARKRVEAELRDKANELARSNEELQRFVYAASHDLKEPIRMVVSFLQLVEKKGVSLHDPQLAQFIRYAVEGAYRMGDLVDGLVSHARVGLHREAGRPVDCNTVFEDSLANLQVAIRNNHAQVTRDHLPTVTGDPAYLVQLFQ